MGLPPAAPAARPDPDPYLVEELTVRLGIFTGCGQGELIRDSFGPPRGLGPRHGLTAPNVWRRASAGRKEAKRPHIASKCKPLHLPTHIFFVCRRGRWRYDLRCEAKCGEKSDR
jgi:hypothetical protein